MLCSSSQQRNQQADSCSFYLHQAFFPWQGTVLAVRGLQISGVLLAAVIIGSQKRQLKQLKGEAVKDMQPATLVRPLPPIQQPCFSEWAGPSMTVLSPLLPWLVLGLVVSCPPQVDWYCLTGG